MIDLRVRALCCAGGLGLALTAAGGDDWVAERDAHGCAIESRPMSDSEGKAMRATCTWPDVPPAKLVELLGQFDRYAEFIEPVTTARIVRREADRALVYQRHHHFGIADREMLLWMRTSLRDGGASYEWVTASEEPLALEDGNVRAPHNVGLWAIAPDPGGGAKVIHEVEMDPGGSVPDWVVELASTRGFVRILADVRQLGAG